MQKRRLARLRPGGYTPVMLAPLATLLAACALAAGPQGRVEPVPRLSLPVSPSAAVVAQLRVDLTPLLAVPGGAALTPLLAALDAGPLRAAGSASLPAALPAPAAAAPLAAAPLAAAPASALAAAPAASAAERLGVAQELLGRHTPESLAALPESERESLLSELWDGWKSRGLLEDGLSPADRLLIEGVDDKALTSSNKSVFLGAGILGYPLEDSLWLQRTRIGDALDENRLRYPEGQRWTNADGTPEFLGTTDEAQTLLDAWGAAAAYAAQIVKQVRAGSAVLPESAAASPAAAAAFARVAAELSAAGDEEALRYLSGQDPTFAAFLLDARKPGYYLYNGEEAVVSRILATAAARELGVRRLDKPGTSGTHASTYLYRPARVVERLREAARGRGEEDARRRLAAYAERLAPLAAPLPRGRTAPYRFAPPETLPGSALDAKANRLDSYPSFKEGFQRWDLPLTAGALRERLASGRAHGSFDERRWAALGRLLAASALQTAPEETSVRVVGQRWQTGGKLVAAGKDGGVLVQMFALDLIADGADPAPFAAAVDGALAR